MELPGNSSGERRGEEEEGNFLQESIEEASPLDIEKTLLTGSKEEEGEDGNETRRGLPPPNSVVPSTGEHRKEFLWSRTYRRYLRSALWNAHCFGVTYKMYLF